MSSQFHLPTTLDPPLTPREAVADTLYRCTLAWDTNSPTLFDTTFLPTALLEVNGATMQGLPEIHAKGNATIFALDTMHLVSNLRIHFHPGEEGTRASLTATVLSQHFRKGKGLECGQKELMAGSLYRGELRREGDGSGLWKFEELRIGSLWMEGEMGVLSGEASWMDDKEKEK